MPFLEAMEEMPKYAKFMKDFLTKKKRYSAEKVEFATGCSALIQKDIPPKSKDPGSFTISATIGAVHGGKALLDLGASVNIMPLSMLKRIGNLEITPTRMTLQLADKSVITPSGVAEDVLVKVGKFTFLVDFVILDIEEDSKVPLILGRPFLVTSGAVINIPEGKLTLKVNEEEETFQVCAKEFPIPVPTLHTDVESYEAKESGKVCFEELPTPINDTKLKVEKGVKMKKGVAASFDDPLKQPWPSGKELPKGSLGTGVNIAGKKVALLSCFKPP